MAKKKAKKNTPRWDIERWSLPAEGVSYLDYTESDFDRWFHSTISAGPAEVPEDGSEVPVMEEWYYTTPDGKELVFQFPSGDSPSLLEIRSFAHNVLLSLDRQAVDPSSNETVVLYSEFLDQSTSVALPRRPIAIAAIELWKHCDERLAKEEESPIFLTGRLLERVRLIGGFEWYIDTGKRLHEHGDRNKPADIPKRAAVLDALSKARKSRPHVGIKAVKQLAADEMGIGINRFYACLKIYAIDNNEWDKI
jgi:hypothetical protein